MTGLTENHIIRLRRERGIRVAVPRKPSTATPVLLGVLGKDVQVRRTQLAIAHRKRGHAAPVDGCPRCESDSPDP